MCYLCYIKKANIIRIWGQILCPRCKKREKVDGKSYCEECLKKISNKYSKEYYKKIK